MYIYRKRSELKLDDYDLVLTCETQETSGSDDVVYEELKRFHISNNEEYKFVFESVSEDGDSAWVLYGYVNINGEVFSASKYDTELLPKEFIIDRNTSNFSAYTSYTATSTWAVHRMSFSLYKRNLNNNPTLALTQPSSNSPLQNRQAFTKGVV